METMHGLDPKTRFEIFTKVPRWFFAQSLSREFGYHRMEVDVGLIQESPLRTDFNATLCRLEEFYPPDPAKISLTARILRARDCRLVMCDISPVGILVAKEAGIPSLLVENFTWDWIYRSYMHTFEAFGKHAEYLEEIFSSVDYLIQTGPFCVPKGADLTTRPVSRRVRTGSAEVRNELNIPQEAPLVMITLGGVPARIPFLDHLKGFPGVYFLIQGGNRAEEFDGKIIVLPYRSNLYHPDLVNASHVVIGKVGYSTLAEVYHAGVAFGYIPRQDFPESRALVSFIREEINGIPIGEEAFFEGLWLSRLEDLISYPPLNRPGPNGSDQIAQFLLNLL